MAKDQKISIVITARNMVAAGFKSVVGATKTLAGRVKRSLAAIGNIAKSAAMAIGLIGAAAIAVGKRVVSQYQAQAAAEAKLSATLKATGYAAGFTTSELKKQAAELQKVTGVGDETILSMQGVLATFKNVRGDTFTRAAAAVLDMGAALGKVGAGSADVETAVMQVGKALNDPIKGISALTRVGIQFTEKQKDQITTLQEAGRIQEAQTIILNELESRFGGTAKAMADSMGGVMQLKAAFRDAQEEIGGAIAETDEFKEVIDKITKGIENLIASGKIELWAQNVRKAINSLRPDMEKMRTVWAWRQAVTEVTRTITGMSLITGASSFVGAIASGANINEAIEAIPASPKEVKAEEKRRLEAIRKRKAAKAAQRDEEEKAAMKAASKKRELDEEEKKRTENLKKNAEEQEKQVADFKKKMATEAEEEEKRKRELDEEEKKRTENLKKNLKKNAEEKKEIEKQVADFKKRMATEAAEETVDALEKERDAAKTLAEMSVRDYIKAKREKEKDAKIREADFKRVASLESETKHGIHLSRRDREFLKEGKFLLAQGQGKLNALDPQLTKAKTELKELQDQSGTLKELLKKLTSIEEQNKIIMTIG